MVDLVRLLDEVVAAGPARPAIHYEGRTLSYGELGDSAARVAAGLAGLGVQAGDRVAFYLPNCPAYFALYFACCRLGAIAVAVNTRFRSLEVADIVGRSGAKVLILWPGFKSIPFLDILAAADSSAFERVESVIVYDEGESAGPPVEVLPGRRTVRYRDLLAARPWPGNRAGPDVPCSIFTTSGTTKAPKFVVHRQYAIARHARQVADAFTWRAEEVTGLAALPLCGVFGLALALGFLAGGRPFVLMPYFDAERMADLLVRHRVSHTAGSDDMMHLLLAAAPGARPFPHLAWAGCANFNTALSDLWDRAEARGLTLVGLYGMSEVQALYSWRDPGAPLRVRRKPGGHLVSPEARVRVRDRATGKLLGPGEAGELEIAGPSRMIGYFENPEATAETLTEDGFVRSGDLGRLEPDGGFEFLTRMGDVLRLGGFLVAPAEIEAPLLDDPAVAGAQVVEVATPRGARPVAFVTLSGAGSFDEAAAIARCATGLAKFKVPLRVVAIDAFPVTMSPNGEKIQRTKLRQMAEAAVAGAVDHPVGRRA